KIILLILIVLMTATSFAQGQTNRDSTSNAVQYRLFATRNMWTFVKLNTRNGQMWQVQYGMSSKERFETVLSLERQVTQEMETNDRFTLYPTQNTYTFILLDQYDGRMWQIQWSTNEKERGIVSRIL
ncbi:MAG TPA: hypothetical protein VFR58_00940, partial [Flavisolibacter sp.]|nr:hypothetical protein [Flavisolibacter sp.]